MFHGRASPKHAQASSAIAKRAWRRASSARVDSGARAPRPSAGASRDNHVERGPGFRTRAGEPPSPLISGISWSVTSTSSSAPVAAAGRRRARRCFSGCATRARRLSWGERASLATKPAGWAMAWPSLAVRGKLLSSTRLLPRRILRRFTERVASAVPARSSTASTSASSCADRRSSAMRSWVRGVRAIHPSLGVAIAARARSDGRRDAHAWSRPSSTSRKSVSERWRRDVAGARAHLGGHSPWSLRPRRFARGTRLRRFADRGGVACLLHS